MLYNNSVMAFLNTQQILQQNGQISTDEWLTKTRNEPGFLGRHYLLPAISSNVARQSVLGQYMLSNKFQAPAQTFEIILVPNAEARSGLGMYGKGDWNLATQNVRGHQGGPVNTIINKAVQVGQSIPLEEWDTIGNDKIVFKMNSQLSLTKKFVQFTVRESDIPQALQLIISNLFNAQIGAFEDIFMVEFVSKGINLNNQFLNGDVTRPVCKYIADPTALVDVHFDQDASVNPKNNAYVQLVTNINTYASEIGLDSIGTEMLVSPMFINNLRNSANWVFNAYSNTTQTEEMRTGIVGTLVNGMPLYQVPRMSARYGAALLNGVKCPDGFIIDRSKIMIPSLVVDSLHMEPAPSNTFSTVLIKALEIFGVYAQPVTIEDYQAQLSGVVQSAAISYFYLFTNPANVTAPTTANIAAPTYAAGLNSSVITFTDGTNPVANAGIKLIDTTVTINTQVMDPSGMRAYLTSSATAANGTATVKFGVISNFYQGVAAGSTMTVSFKFASEDATTPISTGNVTLTLKVEDNGFLVWAA